jgi:transposase-like protein
VLIADAVRTPMVEELLAARGGIIVSHETVRQWAFKFGQQFANQIRRRLPREATIAVSH